MNFKEGERAWGRARATLQIGIHFISIKYSPGPSSLRRSKLGQC